MKFDVRQLWFFLFGCLLALAPVVGTNWLISKQSAVRAQQHLDQQAMLANASIETALKDLVEALRDVAQTAGTNCSPGDIARLRNVTLGNPAVSFLASESGNGGTVCSFPTLEVGALQAFGDTTELFDPAVMVTQVRLMETRMTGLRLTLTGDDGTQTMFVPRQMMPYFFDRLYPTTGVVLSLGDTVLFARDPATLEQSSAANIDMRSMPVVADSLRVQVSIDKKLVEAAYTQIRDWATLGAIFLGALVVLLVTRLIRYTPAQVNEIERAIERGEFKPYYQPVIDIDTGKLVGCEVLVRWEKPDGSRVSPGAFIALAEQTGLAIPMTRKLMQSIVEDVGQAYASRPGLKVAINLFNQHFTSLDIIEDVEMIFGPSPITYNQVVLEITERAPLESMSQAKVIMRKLQRLGCRLALDDAGTGHGGMAYLQELGLDIVKIDKMFIDQLGKSRIGESITHTLTDLAKQLNMDVVAEGVEDIEQIAHLRRYGIRQAQGYLFAPALPAKQYLALVEKLGVAKLRTHASPQQGEAERKAATIRAAAHQIADGSKDDETANAA